MSIVAVLSLNVKKYAIVISKMSIMLFCLGVISELLMVYVPPLWRIRQILALVSVALIGSWTGVLIATAWTTFTPVLLVISLYRILNMLRVGQNRVAPDYLKRAVRRTTVVLTLTHAASYALILADLAVNTQDALITLASLQLITAITVLGITARNLFKTRHNHAGHFFSDRELPTVTVAVPARNETSELASCLQSILTNDYPKFEVLVLDDCSQDRTAEIIRDFAQDGIRFLEGHPPKDHWLAKNQAYDQLAREATGEVILFCGVDVRLGPQAIRALVTTMLNKKRDMISVMPLRIGGGVRTAFVQPMRYWWEIALPRRFFNRPPVLSTCWLIKRKNLKKLGGFAAVSQTIIPEGFFARELIKTDSYAFTRADGELDVRTVKSVESQLLTAVRTRYPQLKKRPEDVLLLSALELLLLLLPFITWLAAIATGFGITAWLAVVASGALILTHYLILSSSNPSNSVVALVNFPFAVVTEIIILHISMYRYEFGSVEWKGRNICIPVMHVVPRLPKA